MISSALPEGSIDGLRQLLARNGLDLSGWSPPDTSTVEALFNELQRGECEITEVQITTAALPQGNFVAEENVGAGAVTVHHWRWVAPAA